MVSDQSWADVENKRAGQGVHLTGSALAELLISDGSAPRISSDPAADAKFQRFLTRVRPVRPVAWNVAGGVDQGVEVGGRFSKMSLNVVEVDIGPKERVVISSFLSEVNRAANAVALVKTRVGTGSGWLFNNSLLMTNNHVLTGERTLPGTIEATPEYAVGGSVVFNYQMDTDGMPTPTDERSLRPDLYFFADLATDVVVCAVDGRPGELWGSIPISLDEPLEVGDDVFIIQHPNGQPKEIAFAGNEVFFVNDRVVMYSTDTNAGSSGSPVMDYRWNAVALHHAGGPLRARHDAPGGYGNEGYLLSAIVPLLPSIPSELQ